MRQNGLIAFVVGQGARESTLYWKIGKSPLVQERYCIPGNGGIPAVHRLDIKDSDLAGIVESAKEKSADLVVVGPEAPLVGGLADMLEEASIPVFGPNKAGARLEGSKVYTKSLCDQLGIPTARWTHSTDFKEARGIINGLLAVPVIKADGLCGGKGVVVPDTKEEAIDAARMMLEEHKLGTAGDVIVIEERLIGRELSVMAFCDGERAMLLPVARDYKRVGENDTGLNTGGMGSYSPVPDVPAGLLDDIRERFMLPIIRHLKYRGAMYVGIMLTEAGPQLLEINVRLGDPETQVILPRIKSDIVEYMLACTVHGGLAGKPPLEVSDEAAVCIVLASKGYPGTPEIGHPIFEAEAAAHRHLFHAGTKFDNSRLVTSGGRVISVVGTGESIDTARRRALRSAGEVVFHGKFFRRDIALNA